MLLISITLLTGINGGIQKHKQIVSIYMSIKQGGFLFYFCFYIRLQ